MERERNSKPSARVHVNPVRKPNDETNIYGYDYTCSCGGHITSYSIAGDLSYMCQQCNSNVSEASLQYAVQEYLYS